MFDINLSAGIEVNTPPGRVTCCLWLVYIVDMKTLCLVIVFSTTRTNTDSVRLRPFLPNKIQNLVFFPRDDFMRTQNKKREGDSFS